MGVTSVFGIGSDAHSHNETIPTTEAAAKDMKSPSNSGIARPTVWTTYTGAARGTDEQFRSPNSQIGRDIPGVYGMYC